MTEQSIWDDPQLNDADFYTLANIGDNCSGVITAIGTHTWPDGKVSPELTLLDDTTKEQTRLTAGQVRLKAELVEKRPNVGDHISVTFARVEPRGGGKTLHHWSVVVTPAGGAPVAAPVAVAAPLVTAPIVDPAAAAAALGIDPAQLAALQNLTPQA